MIHGQHGVGLLLAPWVYAFLCCQNNSPNNPNIAPVQTCLLHNIRSEHLLLNQTLCWKQRSCLPCRLLLNQLYQKKSHHTLYGFLMGLTGGFLTISALPVVHVNPILHENRSGGCHWNRRRRRWRWRWRLRWFLCLLSAVKGLQGAWGLRNMSMWTMR